MIDLLIDKIIEKKNPSVVGLDTCIEYIPDYLIKKYCSKLLDLETASHAILEFNRKIIDAVYEYIPAVKLQIAYYEMYGIPGMQVFNETSEYARKKGLIVIGDIKRNDIGSTAKAYSTAYLGETNLIRTKQRAFCTDFVTVNPYFGIDGINPFIEDCNEFDKGIFILVKTSNPSAGEIQDLTIGDRKVYHSVAEKVVDWGKDLIGKRGYSKIGAVVGATYPEQGIELRKLMPNNYFLVPGYGAQGGGVEDIVGCFDKNGLGAVINASRSVICAWKRSPWNNEYKPEDFDLAARAEVLKMKNDIDAGLREQKSIPW